MRYSIVKICSTDSFCRCGNYHQISTIGSYRTIKEVYKLLHNGGYIPYYYVIVPSDGKKNYYE